MTIVLLTVVPLLQWTDRSVESRSILRNLAERSTRNKAPQGVFAKFDLLPILGVEFAPQQAIFTHACVYKLVLLFLIFFPGSLVPLSAGSFFPHPHSQVFLITSRNSPVPLCLLPFLHAFPEFSSDHLPDGHV